MKALALDLGRARTGVAVTDPSGTIVRPLPVIHEIDRPEGAAALDAVLAEQAPEVIVIGKPLLMSGVAGEQAHHASSFAGRLRARVDARVELADERLSTAEAERRAREAGSDAAIDSVAACVILEAWLRGRAAAA
ncbi:MAG: Holliday junction resolvase RuvX [Thermoleophilia bacterium]|nr:Holliday junction resolvase RuvX [Thermoleophilia bacterium]